VQRVYFRFIFVQFCFGKMEKQIQKKFETEKGKLCILVEDYKYSEFNVLKKCGNIRYN